MVNREVSGTLLINDAYSNTRDWLYANHDYSGQRFVDLDQINAWNASFLRPICLFQVGENDPFQNNPLLYDGVMYITTANSTIAIDPVRCKEKWRHTLEPEHPIWIYTSRGLALKDGKLVRATQDGALLALDAATGDSLWSVQLADPTKGQYMTMPPLIFEDLIIIAPAISEFAIRGWIGAFSLEDGEPVWQFNTIPGPGEPGHESWGNPEAVPKGGGAVWTPLSLDTETGILYVPVANPAPDFYGAIRPGDNLYTSSMIALHVRTGELAWYYQAVPHDVHDWDQTQAGPVFETWVAGKQRKLVTTAGKDGLLHVLDRETREHLYQAEVATRKNVDVPLTPEGVHACPGIAGGVEWASPAYNPRTNMLYVNAVDWCNTISVAEELRHIEGEPYMGGTFQLDPPEESQGWLTAVNASDGSIAWRYRSGRPMLAGITTTSGGLVLTGELEGDFLAFQARTGEVLYRFQTGGPMGGGIATYEIDGVQYIAAVTGSVSAVFDPSGSATIVVFALPE